MGCNIPENWERLPVNTFYSKEYPKSFKKSLKNKKGFVVGNHEIYLQMVENGFLDGVSYSLFLKIISGMADRIIKRMLSEDMFIFLAPYGLGAFYVVERTKPANRVWFKDEKTGKFKRSPKILYKDPHSFNRRFTYKWNKKAVLSKNAELYRIYTLSNLRRSLHNEVMYRSVTKTIKEFESYRVRETPPIKPIKRSR